MARFLHSQVVTANELLSGDVVYLSGKTTWSDKLKDALIAETLEAAEELLAQGTKQQDVIVGAYLADIQRDENGVPQPVHFRETFRTRGPSNYFHGKQAEV